MTAVSRHIATLCDGWCYCHAGKISSFVITSTVVGALAVQKVLSFLFANHVYYIGGFDTFFYPVKTNCAITFIVQKIQTRNICEIRARDGCARLGDGKNKITNCELLEKIRLTNCELQWTHFTYRRRSSISVGTSFALRDQQDQRIQSLAHKAVL